MALPSLSPAQDITDGVLTRPLPELRDLDYVREVLGYRDGRTEVDIDKALASKAVGLGIELPLPRRPSSSAAIATANSSDAESSDHTVVSHHGRTASTSSNETTASGLTSQASNRSTVIPATLTESTNVTSRRRSKGLSFSQYEKYLSQVDPTAQHQPKFLSSPSTKPEWPITPLIGNGRRKSVKDIRRSITGKLRRKRQISSLTLV